MPKQNNKYPRHKADHETPRRTEGGTGGREGAFCLEGRKRLCGGGSLGLGLRAMLPSLFMTWHHREG